MAAMGGMLGKRNQFVREMKMIVKASIHFLDIDVAIKLLLSDIKVAEWRGMSAFFTLLLIDATCFPPKNLVESFQGKKTPRLLCF